MNIIRKLSVGSDYKNAMHYIVGQKVLRGTSLIFQIIENKEKERYYIWIKREDEIIEWKYFNFNMPVAVENNIDF